MFQLIMMGLLAAGAVFAAAKFWDGFTGQYVEQGKQAQIKVDQPIVDDAKHRAENAEADAAQCAEASARQNEAIERANQLVKEAQDAARALSLKYAKEKSDSEARQSVLRAKAGATPKPQACEPTLAETDRVLTETIRKMREPR